MRAHWLVAAGVFAISRAMLAQQGAPPPPPPPPPARAPLPARDAPSMLAVTGTGSLAGIVVDDELPPRALRRVAVRLSGSDTPVGGRLAVTDDAGRFVFNDLPAGRYTLTASRSGFVAVAYGAKRPDRPGSAITLDDGQKLGGVSLTMLRGAVITGTVRDQNGEAAPGQSVSVMRYGFNTQTGERTLQSPGGPLGGATTDDRGMYRIFNLAPGDYLVLTTQSLGIRSGNDVHQVTAADVQWATQQIQGARTAAARGAPPPPAGPNVVYAPVFYPGTPMESGATTITLAAGEERSGIDLALLFVPTSTITGHLVSADGGKPPNARPALLAYDRIEGLPFSGFSTASTAADGTFTFTGVTPGRYAITARPDNGSPVGARGDAPPLSPETLAQYGLADLTVNGQDVNVDVRLQPGMSVSGRLAFVGTSLPPPADLTKVTVSMSAEVRRNGVAIGVSPTTVDAAGHFTFTGVAPGRYRITARVPGSTPTSGWAVRSAMVGAVDAMDAPFEVGSSPVRDMVVSFTDRPSELAGRISDAAGHATPEYFIIVFASDNAFWTPQSRRIQAKRPSSDGRFSFPNMPPGSYYLAAVTDVEQGEWFDPSFLAQMVPASIKVAIVDGEKTTQDIQVATGK